MHLQTFTRIALTIAAAYLGSSHGYAQQVFNFPGPGFLTLQDAVTAAGPGDVVVIADGVYPGFVANGGKVITALNAGMVTINTPIGINNIPAGEQFIMKGIVASRNFGEFSAISMNNSEGLIWIENCDVSAPPQLAIEPLNPWYIPSASIQINACDNVQFVLCNVLGFPGFPSNVFVDGFPASSAIGWNAFDGPRALTFHDCTLRGGNGRLISDGAQFPKGAGQTEPTVGVGSAPALRFAGADDDNMYASLSQFSPGSGPAGASPPIVRIENTDGSQPTLYTKDTLYSGGFLANSLTPETDDLLEIEMDGIGGVYFSDGDDTSPGIQCVYQSGGTGRVYFSHDYAVPPPVQEEVILVVSLASIPGALNIAPSIECSSDCDDNVGSGALCVDAALSTILADPLILTSADQGTSDLEFSFTVPAPVVLFSQPGFWRPDTGEETIASPSALILLP